jgi:hypothetical protein
VKKYLEKIYGAPVFMMDKKKTVHQRLRPWLNVTMVLPDCHFLLGGTDRQPEPLKIDKRLKKKHVTCIFCLTADVARDADE